ncbi:MAG: hypothetical protein ABIJ56_12575 [Pseudomonadota bacterium]
MLPFEFASGGGILLEAPAVTLEPGSMLDARGGGSDASNGGTVKVFSDDFIETGVIHGGRVCMGPQDGNCSSD